MDWDLQLNANFDLIDQQALNVTGTTQTKSGVLSLGGLLLPAFTTGSIPFLAASGTVTTDSSNFFWDDTNNRLGLGTASPAQLLHVAGTAQVTGFKLPTGAGSGYVLTSDASGVGTWQPIGAGTEAAGWTDGGATVHLTTGSDKISLTGTSATEKLEVGGGVKLGAASGATPAAGVVEWDGTNFRGYTGSTWKNLDEAGGGGGGGGGFVDDGTIVRLDTPTDDVHLGAATDPSSKLGITAEANQTAFALAGYSLTGSSALAAVSFAGTWNTSGVPTLLSFALTDTASGAAAKFLDFTVGGTSRFSIAKTGATVSASGLTLDYETTSTTGSGIVFYRGNGAAARTDQWTGANLAGIWTLKKGSDDSAFALTTGGLATFKGSAPGIGWDASTDWTLGYTSGNLSFFANQLPGGSGDEVLRVGTSAITAYQSLVLPAGVGSNLIPTVNDTYDLGTADLRWNQSFISSMNAVVFAERTLSLLGGWLSVSPDEGTFGGAVADDATTINFGKTMTPGHFVEIRGYDTNGVLRAEYLQVGSLVSGTTYNVTRGLNGVSAEWPKGAPFRVNGTTGSGRVELNAYDTPRISVLTQGATYNSATEVVRIGDLNGMPGIATAQYGIFIGDASQYLKYSNGTLMIAGNGSGVTSINGGNITTGTVTATQLNIATLSAITANLGTVTAGTISGVTANFGTGPAVTLDSSGLTIADASSISDTTKLLKFGTNGVFGWFNSRLNLVPFGRVDIGAQTGTFSSTLTTVSLRANNGETGVTGGLVSIDLDANSGVTFDWTTGGAFSDPKIVGPAADESGLVDLGSATRKFGNVYLSLPYRGTVAGEKFVVLTDSSGRLYYGASAGID